MRVLLRVLVLVLGAQACKPLSLSAPQPLDPTAPQHLSPVNPLSSTATRLHSSTALRLQPLGSPAPLVPSSSAPQTFGLSASQPLRSSTLQPLSPSAPHLRGFTPPPLASEPSGRFELVGKRAITHWVNARRNARLVIVTAASLEEFKRAQNLVLPTGEEWVHVTGAEGLNPSGRSPKERDTGAKAAVSAQGVKAISIDMTLSGNDLLMDTLALTSRLHALHRDSLEVMLVKSRAVSDHAMKMISAPRALSWGPDLFKARPAHRPLTFCALGVHEYRELIPLIVEEGDSVLEIGCHSGTTTKLLTKAVGPEGRALGVDIGPRIIDLAVKSHPEVNFAVADAWDAIGLQELAGSKPWDVIFVDVGGLSGGDGFLEAVCLLRQLAATMPGLRSIVIKSQCLRDHATRLLPANELLGPLFRRPEFQC